MRILCVACQLGQVIQRLRCARWIARSRAAIEDVCARATLLGSPVGSFEVEVVNAVCQALVCALELHAGWRGARGSARGCVDVWLTQCVDQNRGLCEVSGVCKKSGAWKARACCALLPHHLHQAGRQALRRHTIDTRFKSAAHVLVWATHSQYEGRIGHLTRYTSSTGLLLRVKLSGQHHIALTSLPQAFTRHGTSCAKQPPPRNSGTITRSISRSSYAYPWYSVTTCMPRVASSAMMKWERERSPTESMHAESRLMAIILHRALSPDKDTS